MCSRTSTPEARHSIRSVRQSRLYLIHGEGQALGRCVLTAAIMHHTMQAAREHRACSLSEVRRALTEASRKIRSRARNHSQHREMKI